MKHKNQRSVCQSLNPILGFGWFTGNSLQNKELIVGNQFYNSKIANAYKNIET